tara:strand:+ start:1896 stop:3113 length:1218 start_codon:yes stop_codon:yes gene_type:complete
MSIFQKAVTAEQRVANAHASIIGHKRYRALSGVMAIGTTAVVDDVPTACTNGRDVMFGRTMVDAIKLPHIRFVLLHERWGHILFKHLITYKWMYDIDPILANMSCDFWINGYLCDENKDDGFAQMPTGDYAGLYDERFRKDDGTWLDPASIFRILRQDQEDGDQDGELPQGNGFDDHDWESANALTDAEAKELQQEVDTALRQGLMASRKMGAGENMMLEELLQPQIDWREALSEFVQATCSGHDCSTWARPNRRYMAADVYMPSTYSETVEELLVNCDTSYSIYRDVTKFLSEIQSICLTVKPERVRVLYWGDEVVRDEVYDSSTMSRLADTTEPQIGGGTEIECVVDYMKENDIRPQAVINFTDGYLAGSWGEWDCPVLWCILDNKRATPDVGKVLHIKSENL